MLTEDFKTTREFWNHALQTAPNQLAAVCLDKRLTYAEADALCKKLAAGLQKATKTTRPSVAVCLPNSLEYYLVYWALVKIGGIIVPVNPWLKADSLMTIFDTVKPNALIVQNENDKEALAAVNGRTDFPVIAVENTPQLIPFQSLFEQGDAFTPVEIAPEDPSIIMHTSGTTSAPKGAVMRHCDLIFNVMTTITAQGFIPSDIHLLVNPMFHCTALYSSLPAAAAQCTPVIITAELRNPNNELITDPDVTIQIVNKLTNEVYDYTFSKRDHDYQLNAGLLPEGLYQYKLEAQMGDRKINVNSTFSVVAIGIEEQQLTADMERMRNVARLTNGKCYTAQQLQQLAEDLRHDTRITSVEHHESRFEDLIHSKWIFFVLIGLAAIEWFLRKMFGSY